MVPAVVVPMAELPLTVNGKLDRAALPAPATARSASRAARRRRPWPRSGRRCWTAGRSAPADHFLELGGHSLVAVRIAARIRADLGTEVQVRDLYDHPLLADFTSRVDALRASGTAAPPPIRRLARERALTMEAGE